jgi:membrane fusion protein, heavy metal efflux system
MTHSRLAVPVVLGLLATSCHASKAASEVGAERPPGQVWLTPAEEAAAKIEVATVNEQDVDDTILTSGTVTLDDLRTGHVFSPVTGRVVRITADLGARVKKGDALAYIESPDIGSAVSDVHKAEADLIAADHDVKRKKALFEQKAVAAGDLEASEDTYRRARAEVQRATLKEQLLRLGNADTVTQRYTLPSPLDGEVLVRNINPGVEVQGQYSGGATVELFTIGELDKVWILGDLYEMDMPRVTVNAPVSVNVVSYPGRTFTGTVDWVSGALDPNTRTAKVRCTFDNPDKLLRPMMYATATISVEREKGLALPRSAVLRIGDKKMVFVEHGEVDGYVRFKRVSVDMDEDESSPWLVVRKDLQEGEKVVVRGGVLLTENL